MVRTKKDYTEADLLNEYEAADYLGLSVHWLRQSRLKIPKWPGPVFVKADGYHVKYSCSDLENFLKARASSAFAVDPADRIAAVS